MVGTPTGRGLLHTKIQIMLSSALISAPVTRDDIQLLYEYDRCANKRVFQAISTLSAEQFTCGLGGRFHSETLLHITVGECGFGLRTGIRHALAPLS